ncbi:mechanosensitive ion channel family protein [Brumimicrobium aurantiacum]|uniref:Mechanosensitive ion channel family protein n=1 Tax=Brumimicrobium aurantiacum TaxID=1737063 RepID=A0A3E1F0M3_9FLAO|nr:mechanosensitive ion channel domain-containing protein [Brumimicrobium aurantiacum]RFC55283.1 mechanosensitive ion channel family protein [Brumimicrobium aurantiacum]
MNTEELFGIPQEEIFSTLVEIGINLIIAIVIFIIGMRLAKFFSKMVAKILEKRDSDKGLISFMNGLVGGLIKVLTVLTVFSQLGIEMTSFIAILGAAGLAIGMAFSGTLSNLAGGVMLLIFKPFTVGDYVECQGESGTVKEIQIFHTVLTTPDNKTIIVPNGSLYNGNITNYSMQPTRRVDFTFGFGYGEDLKLAKQTVLDIVNSHPKVMQDPEPFVKLGSLGDSSVNLTVRVWAKKEDYWDIHFYVNELVYEKFDQEVDGLSIPYPQMDVHVDGNA